jgi:hypothetical protein
LSILLLTLLFTGCQEFIHDSFDTYTGRVIDESGQPLSGVELLFTQDMDFSDFPNPVSNFSIYTIKTDLSGRFKFVVPSRYFNDLYYLQVKPPYWFEIDFGGEKYFLNFTEASSSERDAFGVVALGDLKVVTK